MDIRSMHYDFKVKLNKLDSQQNRNILIPEIDWALNEAQEVFIKSIAEPRISNGLGFEVGQRTIDDLKTIVVDQDLSDLTSCIALTRIDGYQYLATIPTNYMYWVRGKVTVTKGICNGILRAIVAEHDDRHETSNFAKSSFEWREANVEFESRGIKVFSDGTFVPHYLCLSYLKVPPYMHNAQDTVAHTYTLPDKTTVLTGHQDCILPPQVHRQIVDIAVMIVSGQLQIPDYTIKQAKVKLPE